MPVLGSGNCLLELGARAVLKLEHECAKVAAGFGLCGSRGRWLSRLKWFASCDGASKLCQDLRSQLGDALVASLEDQTVEELQSEPGCLTSSFIS